MTIALGAAGATVAVVLAIIGIPVVNACAADDRGLVTCMRDMVDRRFDLPGEVTTEALSLPPPAIELVPEIETELPASQSPSDAEPQLADAPMGQGGPLLPEEPAADNARPQPERVADLGPTPVTELPAPSLPRARPPEAAPPVTPATTNIDAAPSNTTVEPSPTLADEVSSPGSDMSPQPPLALALAPEAPPSDQSEVAPTSPPLETTEKAAPQDVTRPPPSDEPALPAQPPTRAPTPPPVAAQPPPAQDKALAAEQVVPPQPEQVEASQPPLVEPAPSVTPPPVAAAPPVPQELVVAAGPEPEIPPAPPAAAAPVALAPTIDAIELDGARSFVSGSGPAGALMRLSADDEVVGESPVEDGRWLVETGPLLTSPRQELKIEAFDPDTGRSLGEAAITVEIELPPDAPPLEQDPASTPPAEGEPSTAPPEQEAPSSSPRDDQSAPEPEASSAPAESPVVADQPMPATDPPQVDDNPRLADTPAEAPLPGLQPVIPRRESNSVTILGSPAASPSTDTLEAREPAIRAALVTPRPPGEPVRVIRLYPLGDPVYGRFTGGQAIIRRGDTLWTLARRYYGAGIHYRTIFEANRSQIRRPSRIFPGQVFDLPLVTRD